MADRYDALMARREALIGAAQHRQRLMQDEFFRSAPLASRSWTSSAPALAHDGRLTVTVEEIDEYQRRRRAFTFVSEVDGTIRELPTVDATPASSPSAVPGSLAAAPDPRVAQGIPEPGFEELEALARKHLRSAAGAWLELLRPAVRLARAQPGDLVVGQLGGEPVLPINSWPVWEDYGPLSHVATIECAPLAELLPDLQLPDSGRLAFFYFDGQFDNHLTTVGVWDPPTQAGAQTRWLVPRNDAPPQLTYVATPPPPGLVAFSAVALTPITTLTWPTWEHPELLRIWAANGLVGPREGVPAAPVDALYDDLHKRGYTIPNHQVGGHPFPEQGAVELEIAELCARRSGATTIDYSSTAFREQARGWQLLLQVDTDDAAQMMWGDVGKLYFMIRLEDLKARAFEQVAFTWQCG